MSNALPQPRSRIWIYMLLLCCFVLLFLSSMSYFVARLGVQESLNSGVRAETIRGAVRGSSIFRVCPNVPSAWTQKTYPNGMYCIAPGATPELNKSGDLIGAEV